MFPKGPFPTQFYPPGYFPKVGGVIKPSGKGKGPGGVHKHILSHFLTKEFARAALMKAKSLKTEDLLALYLTSSYLRDEAAAQASDMQNRYSSYTVLMSEL